MGFPVLHDDCCAHSNGVTAVVVDEGLVEHVALRVLEALSAGPQSERSLTRDALPSTLTNKVMKTSP